MSSQTLKKTWKGVIKHFKECTLITQQLFHHGVTLSGDNVCPSSHSQVNMCQHIAFSLYTQVAGNMLL